MIRPRSHRDGSGGNGPVRVPDRVVAFADPTLADRVEPVLDAHTGAGGGRFSGVRHATGWDTSDAIRDSRSICGRTFIRQASLV